MSEVDHQAEAEIPEKPVLVLIRDLLLASQVRAAAGGRGINLQVLRDPARLETADGRKLILDLNLPGAIEAAAAYKRRTGQNVTGFVSHVDTQTVARGREAGLDRILARSAFFKDVVSFLE